MTIQEIIEQFIADSFLETPVPIKESSEVLNARMARMKPNYASILRHIGTTGATWGSITGNILDQTDLITYLSSNYYPTSNPANYITLDQARAGITLTTIGNSGAATYNSTTGDLNIPNYASSTFVHEQVVSTSTWNINHSLDGKPIVEIYVNDKQVFADIEYIDNNNVQINFSNNQTGVAICKI